MTQWSPVPETAAEMAAERSPSPIKRIRAPVWRTSWISFLWRSRSRITTVMSSTWRFKLSATMRRLAAMGNSIRTLPAAVGPTQSFSM
jgi:hypothetical protein